MIPNRESCTPIFAISAIVLTMFCGVLHAADERKEYTYIYGAKLDGEASPVFMIIHESLRHLGIGDTPHNRTIITNISLAERHFGEVHTESVKYSFDTEEFGKIYDIVPLSENAVLCRNGENDENIIAKSKLPGLLSLWLKPEKDTTVIPSVDHKFILFENKDKCSIRSTSSDATDDVISTFNYNLMGKRVDWFTYNRVDKLLILCLLIAYGEQEIIRVSGDSDFGTILAKNSDGMHFYSLGKYLGDLCVLGINGDSLLLERLSDMKIMNKWAATQEQNESVFTIIDANGDIKYAYIVNPRIYNGDGYPGKIQTFKIQ